MLWLPLYTVCTRCISGCKCYYSTRLEYNIGLYGQLKLFGWLFILVCPKYVFINLWPWHPWRITLTSRNVRYASFGLVMLSIAFVCNAYTCGSGLASHMIYTWLVWLIVYVNIWNTWQVYSLRTQCLIVYICSLLHTRIRFAWGGTGMVTPSVWDRLNLLNLAFPLEICADNMHANASGLEFDNCCVSVHTLLNWRFHYCECT